MYNVNSYEETLNVQEINENGPQPIKMATVQFSYWRPTFIEYFQILLGKPIRMVSTNESIKLDMNN